GRARPGGGLTDMFEKRTARNRTRAHAGQVRRILLAIDHRDRVALEECHEICEGYFRCIGLTGEHGFTKEHATETDAVEPTDKLIPRPCLDAVHLAFAVPLHIGLLDGRNYPG